MTQLLREWTMEERPLKELMPNPKNPRRMSKQIAQQLSKSLDKFGQCEPIVINDDNTIIGGHQRVKTLKNLGASTAYVMVPSSPLSEEEADELCIRLNKNSGSFDDDLLANAWDIDLLVDCGFTPQELCIDIHEIEEKGDADDEVAPRTEPTSKMGDLYILGEHRLLCGDSTLPANVERLLDGEEPILMVTDPPYGVNYDPDWRGKAGKGQTAYGKVKNDDQVNWALAWYLFPGSVAYVWHPGGKTAEAHQSLHEAEFEVISQIIWVKQQFALSQGNYHWQHEPCFYVRKKGHKHNWQGSRKESTVWEISNLNAFGKSKDEDERTNHSTQKPIECMARPIKNNTAEGEGVYDPFCGSGTTLIAAEKYGRKAYCIELDPVYVDMTIERWKRYRESNGLDSTVTRIPLEEKDE